jgi:putative transposase
MSHTYSKVWLHLVWCPKDRQPVLQPLLQEPLYRHIIETAKHKRIHVAEINGMADHVHCLVQAYPRQSASEIANVLKGESSHWINAQHLTLHHFAWQEGFSVFSVSESLVERVRAYIRGQKEHHRRMSFSAEVERLFALHHVDQGRPSRA